ncbi:acyl carrier protein [Loktanella sp. DSM 29012]|uniref:acyl carrier protein n=1 Tax=Loktanella sp. DSM 29012 TaxID=1881056 RepID=UPI0008CD4931|nr:acyl carrier protein [Loktanella sp. DSM 29012]SEQ14487.1 acyl carrier protein [Loktanella sp. DSM 29012]
MSERQMQYDQTVADRIIQILADQALLDRADVSMDDTLDSLGLDSMGVVETIFAIEETFDIAVPFNANAPQDSGFDVSSVRSIVAAVEDLIQRPG